MMDARMAAGGGGVVGAHNRKGELIEALLAAAGEGSISKRIRARQVRGRHELAKE
jgi:hypothetical protein